MQVKVMEILSIYLSRGDVYFAQFLEVVYQVVWDIDFIINGEARW